jgi:hypothetical protein
MSRKGSSITLGMKCSRSDPRWKVSAIAAIAITITSACASAAINLWLTRTPDSGGTEGRPFPLESVNYFGVNTSSMNGALA